MTMEGINVLSLFDGMSCGQIALERAGVKVANYYASEIDKYASSVTRCNYPDTIFLGDVQHIHYVKGSGFELSGQDSWFNVPQSNHSIDLLIGGSPCQGFSRAGRGLNFKDPRSRLFFEFVRLKKQCNPTYFLLENVPMKHEYELIISKYLGVEPIEINSGLVSAQNRRRLYWTNINSKEFNLFGDTRPSIPQPSDKGIYLKNILESEVDEKYYLSDKLVKYITNETRIKKKFTAVGGEKALPVMSNYFNSSNGTFCIDSNGRIDELKTGTVSSRYYKGTETFGSNPFINERGRIRRLTPTEVERLQTVPEGYTSNVSDTQRYKMLGNGWTVDVIAHIFSYMKFDKAKENRMLKRA